MLDAHPEDWGTRLILADWLEDRGDVRAEGYRALGVLRKRPETGAGLHKLVAGGSHERTMRSLAWFPLQPWSKSIYYRLPKDWFGLVGAASCNWHPFATRREAEDAAALAFAQLPAARRAELLNPQGAVA